MNSRPAAKKILAAAVAAAYPFAILCALKSGGGLAAVAAVLLAAAVAGFFLNGQKFMLLCALAVIAAAVILRRAEFVKIYPVAMNFAFMSAFALSLFKKPLVQTIAEKTRGKLPPEGVEYARKATVAWFFFMLFLTLCSAATLFASDEVWAVFNGFVSYVLIALMFLAEYIARKNCLPKNVR
ncbi:MAG: hypothetical protein IKO42_01760 [Opitutales bacterium]|nr:hypothetical protein [Opitutales bacterium]